ncbi:MAG TPA: hypothetical protein GX739_02090 [Firmicutes bacterium]|nr:hypothetical protein [Bacillota bacterium]
MIALMDSGPWYLRLLWRVPQLPKKKIRFFMRLGDYFLDKEDDAAARFCYHKAKELADSIGAVHYLKKTNDKLSNLS